LERVVQKGVIFGGLAGTVVGIVTMYVSFTILKRPEILLDWAALVFSGLATGLIMFFIVWGHFQKDPTPPPPPQKPD
jgi:hypothetical protein